MKLKVSARKEMRKAKREAKKRKSVPIAKKSLQIDVAEEVKPKSISKPKSGSVSRQRKSELPFFVEETDEDRDIKRLERLLGVTDKKKGAAKLNKEYEIYEGIGGNFGSFLMSLDKLSEDTSKKRKKVDDPEDDEDDESVTYQSEEEEEVEVNRNKAGSKQSHHVIDDDDQEQSDEDIDQMFPGSETDENVYEDDENEDNDHESVDDDDDDDGDSEEEAFAEEEGSEISEIIDDLAEEQNDSESEIEDDLNHDTESDSGDQMDEFDGSESDVDSEDNASEADEAKLEERGDDKFVSNVYRPVAGEDIYGRAVAGTEGGPAQQKYIPPARRAMLATIDESSENVILLRRSITGIMNRLSAQTKDTAWRAIKSLYDTNSTTICNTVFRDSIVASCVSSTQVLHAIIPEVAAVLAALHFTVGKDVGAFVIESITKTFMKELEAMNLATTATIKSLGSTSAVDNTYHALLSNKKAINLLLVLIYSYNLRILHHTLIVDIMSTLTQTDEETKAVKTSSIPTLSLGETQVEMIVCIVDHCGFHLRGDDPANLARIVSSVMAQTSQKAVRQLQPPTFGGKPQDESDAFSGSELNGRMKFMLDALTDLKNNKSRRNQGPHKEAVTNLRKWLGSSVKGTAASTGLGGDMSLHVGLSDILNADGKGRWWKAGAAWLGAEATAGDQSSSSRNQKGKESTLGVDNGTNLAKSSKSSEEEALLLKMAEKMRFTTAIRRSIFMVTMTSRDVIDAFERLQKLNLPGKSDREIVRVVLECCAQEHSYNAFYSQLISQFCKFNRQFKTTAQYAIHDFMKVLSEENVKPRRAMNVGRLFAHLVSTFDLPLSMLKRLDVAKLSDPLKLYLTTFFVALFTSKISQDSFQSILDRVATTKDFAIARDNILYFMKKHLPSVDVGLDEATAMQARSRRKLTVKTLETMTQLLEGIPMEDSYAGDMAAAIRDR